MSIASIVGWSAVLLSVIASWPQLVRLVRTRSTDGLSSAAALGGVLSAGTWLTYGLVIQDATQITTNVVVLLAAAGVLGVLVQVNAVRLVPTVAVLAVYIGMLLAAAHWHFTAAISVAALTWSTIRFVPLVAAVWGKELQQLSGLCPWTTLLGTACSVIWLAYGALVADLTVAVSSVLGLLVGAVLLWHRLPLWYLRTYVARRAARVAVLGRRFATSS